MITFESITDGGYWPAALLAAFMVSVLIILIYVAGKDSVIGKRSRGFEVKLNTPDLGSENDRE